MSNNGTKNPVVFFIQQSWLLMAASIIFGCLLSSLNMAWGPLIEENQKGKFSKLAGGLINEAKTFEAAMEPISIPQAKGAPVEVLVQKGLDANGKTVGFVFQCEGVGYGGTIKLLVGVDAAFETIQGFGVLESSETPGFGDKINIKPEDGGVYQPQFIGAPVAPLTLSKIGDASVIDDEIVAITGATVTSDAVVKIFNAFLVPVKEKVIEAGLLK
ncbi:MAG: FMN-binding protein [Planctomycetota bacterium]|jgi:electron transport complex protein RnfG